MFVANSRSAVCSIKKWLRLWLQFPAFAAVPRRSPWFKRAAHGPYGPKRTAANAIMTAWQCKGQGLESPQLHPSEQAALPCGRAA